MDKLEKIVWIITALAVLGVIGLAAIGPLKSELKDEVIGDDFARANPHLKRQGNRFVPEPPGPIQQQATFAARSGARRPPPTPATPRSAGAPAAPEQPPAPPSAPQRPYDPGTVVATPVYIPNSMAQKYQHFEDVVDLGMTAYGEDVTMPDGQIGFQFREIQEDSALTTRLGFMPGDVIISVNGYPANKGNSRQLYETLKNERDFNVLILRGGQQQALQYHIQ